MRIIKILAAVAGGIVGLILIGLLAVWLLVNPNDYKGRIANAVKDSTGRELILKGDIKLSVFPWVALALGPASLGNPPGFDAEPFLAFNKAAVRVKLLPLLSKQLEIDKVELDGLDLRLRKNAQGVGNWENFGKSKTPEQQPSGSASGGSLKDLGGIRVTNGRVSYQNMVVDKFNFDTGAFSDKSTTPINLSLVASRGTANESVTLSAKFNLSVDEDKKDLQLAAVNISGQVSTPGDGRPTSYDLTAPTLALNLDKQTLAIPAFSASYSSAKVSGKLQGTKIIDDLTLTGSVALAPLVLKEFAPRLGITLPKTTDPRALAMLSASSEFSYDAQEIKLDAMQAQLDDTHLKGDVAVLTEPKAIKFALTVDTMNLDRYLNPDKNPPPKPAEPDKAAASKLPDLDGTLSVGALHLSPLDFTNVRLTLASKDNVVHLYPALAQIDGGNYSGNVTLDNRAAAPAISIDEHLSSVDMTKLMAATAYKGRVSGRGNVNIKATTQGAAIDAIMKTLNGHFDANLADGALEGVDLGYELALAQSLIKHDAQPTKSNPPRTKFDVFKMSAEITNGVAVTKDLTISSPIMKVTGQGNANLVSKGIDFNMLASVLKAPGTSAADIPLKITGTYVDPTIRPDVEALAKGQVKQKLQDVLQKNGLKGLFGK